MAAHYLIEAANEILAKTGNNLEPSLDDLRMVFARGCRTLELLESDASFKRDVAILQQREPQTLVERQGILGDVGYFTNGFLQIERKVLENAGVAPAVTSYIIGHAAAVRDACHGDLPSLNGKELLDEIASLRAGVCSTARDLHRSQQKATKEKSGFRKKVEALALGISGSVTIFLNTGATAATLGLSSAGAAVSVAIGVALIRDGVSHFRK